MSLFIFLSRHNCHLLISNGFELLCKVCYLKFLLIVFVVSLHHQALTSSGAECYFSKRRYQLFLVRSFFLIFFHSWSLKCLTFLRMAFFFFLYRFWELLSFSFCTDLVTYLDERFVAVPGVLKHYINKWICQRFIGNLRSLIQNI